MNKGIIAELQKTTSISIIEKHLIYSFLKTKGILYGKSPIISSFLKCFSPQSQLLKKIAALNINNLKLLENCLELLIPNEDRKFNGAFFTPTYIVNFIIKELKPSFQFLSFVLVAPPLCSLRLTFFFKHKVING